MRIILAFDANAKLINFAKKLKTAAAGGCYEFVKIK